MSVATRNNKNNEKTAALSAKDARAPSQEVAVALLREKHKGGGVTTKLAKK